MMEDWKCDAEGCDADYTGPCNKGCGKAYWGDHVDNHTCPESAEEQKAEPTWQEEVNNTNNEQATEAARPEEGTWPE